MSFKTTSMAMSVSFFGLTGLAGAAVVTVDDDGPAQYDSIQAAVDSASSSEATEIQVMPGVYSGDGEYVVDTLGKPVTIIAREGSGTVTLDGKQRRGVVRCVNGEDEDTRFVGLKLTGGQAQYGAGVYLSNTNPTFNNCTIYDNTAAKYGGGLYSSTGRPQIQDCVFAGNHSNRHGGGLYLFKSNAVITGGKIAVNTSYYSGGGIFVSGGRPVISDCMLRENSASLVGGGVAIENRAAMVFEECDLLDNTAGNQGGGLSLSGNSRLSMDQCVVDGNTANASGGGIAVIRCGSDAARLTFCKISNNEVLHMHGFGGGLYIESARGKNSAIGVSLWDSTIADNQAPLKGGGVYLEDSRISMTNGKCTGNSSNMGGGLYGLKSKASCTRSTFKGNHAVTGGGLYIEFKAIGSNPEFHLMDGEVSGNTADSQGGGIYSVGTFVVGSKVALEGTMIKDNLAKHQGGGVCADVGSTFYMDNCEFQANEVVSSDATADHGGGAIYSERTSYAELTACTFDRNTSNRFGGAVYLKSVSKFTGCLFRSNSATDHGGACYVIDHVAPRFEENCVFSNNESGQKGGGIYTDDGAHPHIFNTSFMSNQALYGGAIFGNDHAGLMIQHCDFMGNMAQERGGAVGLWNLSTPSIYKCNFLDNSAKRGGAVYTQFQSNPVYNQCEFEGNKAKDLGGAACDIGGSPAVYNYCSFRDNQATGENGGQGSGGAVHADGSEVRYLHCEFADNLAASRGGAIYNWNCAPEVTECLVQTNVAAIGGGMFTTPGYQPPVKDSEICGNLPDQIVGEWLDLGGNLVNEFCEPDCPSDVNGDGVVNVLDLIAWINVYGTNDPAMDINGDSVINVHDLIFIISNFGPCE